MNTAHDSAAHFRNLRAGLGTNRLVGSHLPDERINPTGFARAAATIQQWPGYAPPPLRRLQGQVTGILAANQGG